MIKSQVTRTVRVTFSVGGLTIRHGDALAGFAERSVTEFSGDHSAQRHMHLEIRSGSRCDFAPTRPQPGIPGCSKTLRRVSTLM